MDGELSPALRLALAEIAAGRVAQVSPDVLPLLVRRDLVRWIDSGSGFGAWAVTPDGRARLQVSPVPAADGVPQVAVSLADLAAVYGYARQADADDDPAMRRVAALPGQAAEVRDAR